MTTTLTHLELIFHYRICNKARTIFISSIRNISPIPSTPRTPSNHLSLQPPPLKKYKPAPQLPCQTNRAQTQHPQSPTTTSKQNPPSPTLPRHLNSPLPPINLHNPPPHPWILRHVISLPPPPILLALPHLPCTPSFHVRSRLAETRDLGC